MELKDWLNSINQTKQNLIDEDPSLEKEYPPYIINRCFSGHLDSVLFANEMNQRHFLDKKLQNSFLINTVRSRKRPFAKWVKSEKSEDIECIKKYFNYSDMRALEVLPILSEEQIQQLKEKTESGGLRK